MKWISAASIYLSYSPTSAPCCVKTKAKGAILDELSCELKKGSILEFCERHLPPIREAFEAISLFGLPAQTPPRGRQSSPGLLNRLDVGQWMPRALAFLDPA